MDTRLAILSAAAFAGVVVGGAVIARPGLASNLNPATLWSGTGNASAANQAPGDVQFADQNSQTDQSGQQAWGDDEHEAREHSRDGRSRDSTTARSGRSSERQHEEDDD